MAGPSSSPSSSKTHKLYFVIQIVFRILAIGTTVAAATLMLTNHETTLVYGVQLGARYSYSPAFKFFAYANIVALALSVVVAFIFMGTKAVHPTSYSFLFLHDFIVALLLMAGFAAASAIAYVGKYGNSHTGWMPICDHFAKFCHRTLASLILGFFGIIIYLILTLLSANNSTQLIQAT